LTLNFIIFNIKYKITLLTWETPSAIVFIHSNSGDGTIAVAAKKTLNLKKLEMDSSPEIPTVESVAVSKSVK